MKKTIENSIYIYHFRSNFALLPRVVLVDRKEPLSSKISNRINITTQHREYSKISAWMIHRGPIAAAKNP